MVLPGLRVWTVLLVACRCVCDETRPVYMVAIPAVIQAGSEAKVCASLLQPTEPLVMTITLSANQEKRTLLRQSTHREFHHCFQFQAPHVESEEVQNLQVEVRGKTFLSTEERKIMIKPYGPMTFVQTDKPIYIPGQTVNFRIITLDTNFVPVNQQYNIVELQDVNQNRIGQWVNTTSSGTVLQLAHTLNSEAAVGSYVITVWIGKDDIHQDFKVQKYVLPKFDVRVNLSNEINIVQKQYRVEVCATYTYGQPVPGEAELELCRPLQTFSDPSEVPDYTAPCLRESIKMNQTGCASHVFDMTVFLHAEEKMLKDSFRFTAKVEEEGTGVTRSEDKDMALSYVIGTLSFVDAPQTYEHGSLIKGKIKVVHFDNTPISHMLVYMFEEKGWPLRRLQNVTTNSQGIASFSLNTTNMAKEDIHLVLSDTAEAKYSGYRVPHFTEGRHVISLIQSNEPGSERPSSLTIQNLDNPLPCGQKVSVTVQYAIVGEPKSSIDVIYLALSRGVIGQHGHVKVQVHQGSVTEGHLVLNLAVSPDMAPVVQLLVYSVLPSEKVIAHSLNLPTEKCFRNKVSVALSPSKAVPGEVNTLTLSALPGSLCGLSAVDKSVYLMEPGKRLDADKVFNLLPVKEGPYIPYQIQDPDECLPVKLRRLVRSLNVGPSVGINDPYQVFQKLGLKLATNLQIRIPSCLSYRGNKYYNGVFGRLERLVFMSPSERHEVPEAEHVVGVVPPPMQTTRTFFPETWIWDLVEVGKSGSTKVSLTVPDTITSWETDAFCLAPGGFGLAPPVELTVFQPFFLELSLPYSIVRGERFELKATVFNYLAKCITVSVTPTPSVDYTLTPLENAQYSSCLCANGRKTFGWMMAPSVLGVLHVMVSAAAVHSNTACNREAVIVPERGRVDTVARSLLVKAEGVEKTDTYNWLLCPRGEVLTEEVTLELPKNVVSGSARASLSVLGDIMGRALKNLDGLLQMPYGCGEQNIALLAPNIYILEYLKDTEQLTPAILEKATAFLTSGYQRQLNYKHVDGAYSTFGQGSGNTWLTAFVLRAFGRARSYIYIDPVKLEESKTWLGRQQEQDGCFKILGKLFNNKMKGGVADEVTMTAYVTASMLELNTSVSDPVVLRGLSCLRKSTSKLSNTYTTALLAYTFTLAKDMEIRDQLLQHLDKISFKQGGLLHWTQTSTETSASLAVEMSSYVLLATLGSSPLSAADLGYASRIVRWLVRQQNAYGGFSSTQDTVVALQALALYSTKVYSSEGISTVTVKSPSGEKQLFDINQNNRLLYQERALQDTRGKYSIEVKGSACASVQVALHYNIPTPRNSMLSIRVKSEVNCTSSTLRRRVRLTLQSGYLGNQLTTNMVIVDVKMLSGFIPDKESLTRLRNTSLVDRVDTKDDHVLIYLTELQPRRLVNHVLDIIEEHPVQSLKPAVVKVYDYYQPSDRAETQYVIHCE